MVKIQFYIQNYKENKKILNDSIKNEDYLKSKIWKNIIINSFKMLQIIETNNHMI